MSNQQNKQLHTLLAATGMMEQKANLVLGFSDGKSESSKDLTDAQAKEMITYLQSRQAPSFDGVVEAAANKMRRKLISMAYEMHWAKAGEWKAAVAAIDSFCLSPKGLFKKELQKHNYNELAQAVTQFEMMYKKYLKKF